MPAKRGSVAHVACQTCRGRKVKCDGVTPICGRCCSGDLPCSYTSDPTLPRSVALRAERERLQIEYDRLSRLHTRLKKRIEAEAPTLFSLISEEEKTSEQYDVGRAHLPLADRAPRAEHSGPLTTMQCSDTLDSAALSAETQSSNASAYQETQAYNDMGQRSSLLYPEIGQQAAANICVSHMVLLWPSVYPLLVLDGERPAPDLQSLATIGSMWLLNKSLARRTEYLACDNESAPLHRLQSGAVIFRDLSVQQVDIYSAAYFDTFNRLFPLLDFDVFMDEVAAKVLREGYTDNDSRSVLALLVFALGRLAHDGGFQHPIGTGLVRHIGSLGGTINQPSGLSLFNEARRRLGLVATRCTLEAVQILLLEATYYEACAQHADFSSSISTACRSCIFLVQSQAIDWSSRYGDLVKRAFWTCLLHERSLCLEFGMTATGIETLTNLVPLPRVTKLTLDPDCPSGAKNQFNNYHMYQFGALLSLDQLLTNATSVIKHQEQIIFDRIQVSDSTTCYNADHTDFGSALGVDQTHRHKYEGTSPALTQDLITKLESWRHALPERLRWRDGSEFDHEAIDMRNKSPLLSLFSFLQDARLDIVDVNTNIAAAHLRICFYQARFLICRPFVYKALHYREQMAAVDRKLCGFAIKAACLWSTSASWSGNKKYLIPHSFSWTQSFLTMLVILTLCLKDEYLSNICWENDVAKDVIERAISATRAWLEDVSEIDGIAEWGLKLRLNL